MVTKARAVEGQLVHIVSRGVDKRKIFMDDQDRVRFIHDLFEFNDQNDIDNLYYRFRQNRFLRGSDFGFKVKDRKPRKLLVELHVFCLMPNHYHLLLSQMVEGGMTKFMTRLNMGYAKYFNERHERTGTLFESRYKSVAVTDESHFLHLPYYIHCNPLDLVMPGWRERQLDSYKKAESFLKSYRWSSHLDYCGIKNFPSVTQKGFLLSFFGGSEKYSKNITGWLRDIELESMNQLLLE